MGPPWVRMSIWPKAWNPEMTPMIAAKNRIGESRGSVIWRNRTKADAPSTLDASSTSWGSDCSAALMRMKVNPMFCQMVTRATAGSAQCGLFEDPVAALLAERRS